jgi:hypothetical protein
VLKTVEILEKALRFWEDSCFLKEMAYHLLALDGETAGQDADRLAPWRDFRDHLLQAQTEGVSFDHERFIPAYHDGRLEQSDGMNDLVPLALWQWSKHSRRVFRLTSELHDLLRVTGFRRDLTVADLQMPFEAFVVTVMDDDGEAVGLSPEDMVGAVSFMIPPEMFKATSIVGVMEFSRIFGEHRPISSFERDTIRREIRQGGFRKTRRIMDEYRARNGSVSVPQTVCVAAGNAYAKKVNQIEEDLREMGDKRSADAFHLIAALCLYLQTLPQGSPHRSAWKKPQLSRPDPKAVINGAHVCTVSSTHRLTSEERMIIRDMDIAQATGREVSAHMRKMYFRRRPGCGNDPTAPRIVRVRAVMVRKDRLGPGELIGGTTAKVG